MYIPNETHFTLLSLIMTAPLEAHSGFSSGDSMLSNIQIYIAYLLNTS